MNKQVTRLYEFELNKKIQTVQKVNSKFGNYTYQNEQTKFS